MVTSASKAALASSLSRTGKSRRTEFLDDTPIEWHLPFARRQNQTLLHTAVIGLVVVIVAGFAARPALIAQVAPGQTAQTEFSAGWLGLTPGGNVLTNSNQVDFVSDLGIRRMQAQAGLWFATKRNRSGLFVEDIP